MSDFLSEVYYLVLDILRDLAGEFLAWAIVCLLIGLPILVLTYYSMKRGLAGRGIHWNVQWHAKSPGSTPPAGVLRQDTELVQSRDRTRAALQGVYNGLLIGVGTLLLAAAMYTAMAATTANGLGLVAFLLFAGAGAAFAHLWSHNRRYRSRSSGVGGLIGALDPQVSVHAEVQVLNQQASDRLQELSRQGAPLEEICRQLQPEYDQWTPFRRQAFQKVIQSVTQHYSGTKQT